jgi:hypothetical protein
MGVFIPRHAVFNGKHISGEGGCKHQQPFARWL